MQHKGEDEPGLPLIDSIYEALDRGDPDAALALACEALEHDDRDPVVQLLAAVALLELDRPADAVVRLRRATELDPDDPELRANLALALFRSCAFDDAAAEARRAVEADDTLPDAHYIQGLVLERQGRLSEAEDRFERAALLDPERFSRPTRMRRASFEAHVSRAIDALPEPYRRHLGEVAVTVEDLPSDAILFDESPALDPEQLLGLFVGVPLDQAGSPPGGDLPARILLFQRNLERMALEESELIEEISITLYHELGHYLGLDEQELEWIDLA